MTIRMRLGLAALTSALLLSACSPADDDSGPLAIDYAAIVGGDGATNEGIERGSVSDVYADNTSTDLQLHWTVDKPSDPPQYTVDWFISDDLVIDGSDIKIAYNACGFSSSPTCAGDSGTLNCSFDVNDVLDCGEDIYSRHDLTGYFTAHGARVRYYLILRVSNAISPENDTRVFEANFL